MRKRQKKASVVTECLPTQVQTFAPQDKGDLDDDFARLGFRFSLNDETTHHCPNLTSDLKKMKKARGRDHMRAQLAQLKAERNQERSQDVAPLEASVETTPVKPVVKTPVQTEPMSSLSENDAGDLTYTYMENSVVPEQDVAPALDADVAEKMDSLIRNLTADTSEKNPTVSRFEIATGPSATVEAEKVEKSEEPATKVLSKTSRAALKFLRDTHFSKLTMPKIQRYSFPKM